MLTKERIDKFYIDLEALGLKRPIAAISQATGYSKGNVSEWVNKKKEPSENFIDKFYLEFYKDSMNGNASQSGASGNGTLSGSITIADYKSEIEKRIAEIEARRRDAEAMYQDVKKEKGILYDIIKENLTLLVANSNETLKRLEKVLLFDRADHETIMNSQDRAEHLPRGTSTKAAGNLAVQKAKRLRKKDKSHQRDVDK
jgi:hypothetical protein